jgi:hypothetical protein
MGSGPEPLGKAPQSFEGKRMTVHQAGPTPVAVIVVMYIVLGEVVKRIFYRHFEPTGAGHA